MINLPLSKNFDHLSTRYLLLLPLFKILWKLPLIWTKTVFATLELLFLCFLHFCNFSKLLTLYSIYKIYVKYYFAIAKLSRIFFWKCVQMLQIKPKLNQKFPSCLRAPMHQQIQGEAKSRLPFLELQTGAPDQPKIIKNSRKCFKRKKS